MFCEIFVSVYVCVHVHESLGGLVLCVGLTCKVYFLIWLVVKDYTFSGAWDHLHFIYPDSAVPSPVLAQRDFKFFSLIYE